MSSKIIRRIIQTAKAPAAIGPYSQAVQENHTLYISGQLGLDPESMIFVSDTDVQAQTKQALSNMGAILDAAGSSFKNVIKTTILIADMDDFSKVNEVYATFFENPYPARACFAVKTLPKNGLVEIEAVALVGEVENQ